MTNTTKSADRRPGDLLLDRYLPVASEEEREAFRDFASLLIRIGERISEEQGEVPSAGAGLGP